MARHIVLRTTPRVDECIAALDFSIEKQLPPIVDGMPRIKYQWSSNHEETVAEAVKSRVRERSIISIRTSLIQIAKNAEIRMAVTWAYVKAPKKKAALSGCFSTGPDEIALLIPSKPPETSNEAKLRIGPGIESLNEEVTSTQGMILIFEETSFDLAIPYCLVLFPSSRH